jgi:Arc/MetJ-type ribon-helix-helix transcriptional regulator
MTDLAQDRRTLMGKPAFIGGEVSDDVYADVQSAVSSGEVASPDALVSQLVTDWSSRRAETPQFVAQVRAAIDESRRDTRPAVPAGDVFDRLDARLAALIEAEDTSQ